MKAYTASGIKPPQPGCEIAWIVLVFPSATSYSPPTSLSMHPTRSSNKDCRLVVERPFLWNRPWPLNKVELPAMRLHSNLNPHRSVDQSVFQLPIYHPWLGTYKGLNHRIC